MLWLVTWWLGLVVSNALLANRHSDGFFNIIAFRNLAGT